MGHIPGHMTKDITPEELKYGVGDAYSPPQQATPGILGIGNMLPPLFNNRVPLPDLESIGNSNFQPEDDDLIGFKPPGMQTADVRKYYYKGKEQQGSSTYIGALKKFLEAQGKGDLLNLNMDQELISQPGGPSQPIGSIPSPVMPLPGPGLKEFPMPEIPDYTERFQGYDTKIGGFDNQFKDIIGRLEKLEQGIGGISSTPTTPSSPLEGGVFSVYKGNNSRGY